MKKFVKYLMIIPFFITVAYVNAQGDSTKLVFTSENDTSELDKLFDPIDKVKFYFDGEENVKIGLEAGRFTKIKYYETGEVLSETEMTPVLIENTVTNGKQKSPNIPIVQTTYSIGLKANGIYKEYYKNGKLRMYGKFKYGDKVGKWKYYKER